MYFYEKIKNMCKNRDTVMYVDMDGVIAAYDFGNPLDFANKRPLFTNIKKLYSDSIDGFLLGASSVDINELKEIVKCIK